MKTKLHHYGYYLNKPADKAAYEAMVETIKANSEGRGHWMNCWGVDRWDSSKTGSTEEVELETSYLFSNQWNETTASGNRRLFDWFEEYRGSGSYKRGHWLEITAEMALARRSTLQCGYCGKHYGPLHEPIPGVFCTACLDSVYLKEDQLYLTRLENLIGKRNYAPLTDAEKAELLPRYVERQTTGKDSRNVQRREGQRQRVLADYAKTIADATTKRDGLLWLWDRGFDLDNVIFYAHVQRFGFGWRSPLSGDVLDRVLREISEFPYGYTIQTADKRTLENSLP